MLRKIIILTLIPVVFSTVIACAPVSEPTEIINSMINSTHNGSGSYEDVVVSEDNGSFNSESLTSENVMVQSTENRSGYISSDHTLISETIESQMVSSADKVKVQCVYILDDKSNVVQVFGMIGSGGQPGRSDHSDVPENVICTAESYNPLQAAIDWAKANDLKRIYLDAGNYYNDVILKTNYSFAFHIPSDMHITGVINSFGEPVSRISVNKELSEFYDLVIVGSENRTNSFDGQMNDFLLKDVMLDGRSITNVGIWTTGGSGTKYINVHAKNLNLSALILGSWNSSKHDPEDENGALISWARNFEIRDCHVHSCGGDGIAVLGKNGEIYNNRCDFTTSKVDNAITLFSSSENIRIYNNTLNNFPTGVGLDGTYLLFNDLHNIDQTQAFEIWANKLWGGYSQNIMIYNNKISNCKNGIILYRSKGSLIFDNDIVPPVNKADSVGIKLNESFGSFVWNNRVNGFALGLWLWSYTNSCKYEGEPAGCSFNMIGVDPEGAKNGNQFKDCSLGILLSKGILDPSIRNNTFCNNDFSGCAKAADWSGGDEGEGRQFSYDNIYTPNPEGINYSVLINKKVQEN